jgi:hypothetical protein
VRRSLATPCSRLWGGADSQSEFGANDVQRDYIRKGVRLFGFILGQKSLYGFYKTIPGNNEIPFAPDTDEIGGLAVQTGGLLAVENTQMEQKTYSLTNTRLQQLQTTTHRFCTLMIAPYRMSVRIDSKEQFEKWSVELSKSIKSKIPEAAVLYPHQLPAYSTANAP